jgi:hypothetical protein
MAMKVQGGRMVPTMDPTRANNARQRLGKSLVDINTELNAAWSAMSELKKDGQSNSLVRMPNVLAVEQHIDKARNEMRQALNKINSLISG